MRRLLVLLLIGLIVLTGCARAEPVETETLSSENFVVHYPVGHGEAGRDVLRVLEQSFERVVGNLAPPAGGKYTVRLFPSVRTFHRAIGLSNAPAWVVGIARGGDEVLMVSPRNPGPKHSYQSLLQVAVHEFVHCVTYRLAAGGAHSRIPLWLWESIALYEARQFRNPRHFDYMRAGNYPRFMDIDNPLDDPRIYDIGFTVMEYLLETYGYASVRQLVINQGNVEKVLGLSDDEFYAAWYAFVQKRYLD